MGKRKTTSDDCDGGKKYKRPPSAYSLFVKATWEKDEKKVNFASFTKGCSALWAKMTDDEKQIYKDEAANMKEKWDGEKSEAKKADSKKKRAPGPYIIFCSDMREKIKKENPTFSMTQVSKELGRLWNKLTDVEKAKYHQKASEEKEKNNQGEEKPISEEKGEESPIKKKGKNEKAAKSALSS